MKRILLTGGSGFIGRNIRESFLARKYEILSPAHAELDVFDDESVETFFRKNAVDYVIHAATKPGHRNAKDPTNLFYANTRMFFNLARFSDQYEKMLVLGSGAIYDNRAYHHAMREVEWKDHLPLDEHGFCKYVCTEAIEHKENITDLRIFGIFGRYEDYSIRFISNMICKALFGLPLTMNQDRLFSYLFIDDLMPILDLMLERSLRFKSYNIVPDETCSLYNLAEMVKTKIDDMLPIFAAKPGRGSEYTGDNSRLKAEFANLVFTPMTDAVDLLIEYYNKNIECIQRHLLEVDK
jgi:GDP-L-fucose synthase